MDVKSRKTALIIILTIFTVGTLTVSGIMQSTERLTSTGIIIETAPTPFTPPKISGGGSSGGGGTSPPPALPIILNLYCDVGCTQTLTQVVWGDIEVGSESQATVYVKNDGQTSATLALSSNSWNPSNLQNYLTLDWDYSGQAIDSGQVLEITLSLMVDSDCPPTAAFDLQIVIIAS
ncbi:MAG: hypothetical protein ACTSQH_09040 [Candidatus Hodarchaeales archaeon]